MKKLITISILISLGFSSYVSAGGGTTLLKLGVKGSSNSEGQGIIIFAVVIIVIIGIIIYLLRFLPNTVGSVTRGYAKYVKLACKELNISTDESLNRNEIDEIFASLMNFEGCASNEFKKLVLKSAKQHHVIPAYREEAEIKAKDIAYMIIFTRMGYYDGRPIINHIDIVIEDILKKQFGY